MTMPPLPSWNLTSLVFFIDTHILDAPDDASVLLRKLYDTNWISLRRTDAMDTELAAAPEEKWAELTEASAGYAESFGPMVLDHSRLDHSVLGSDEDVARDDLVFSTLFPGADRATCRKNHIRDAMHVATAIRYGGLAFVTHERKLLNKSDQIAGLFQGFRIWSPTQALAEAAGAVARARELYRREPERGSLPEWPTVEELRSV
ncbi:hypothetical protein [Streptomyces muensis]|uniref:Uncharacterized protein n=1 Tax=Streptomyces muensis TaxID=1077944 RepID=A0A9X1TLJ5_STRM4|nr:hypothetical protein [Streptomyces muensis]MCF1596516.1 hypothetical protein [Streptomyces muensis]